MKKPAVGIKISKRTVSSVCIHLKRNIMVFHGSGELPVKRFQIDRRFIAIYSDQIAWPIISKSPEEAAVITESK